MTEPAVPLKAVTDITQLMKKWEEECGNINYDPIPLLSRMAEIVEADTDTFMKMDPDPFDERHPSRVDPSSPLGQVLKVIFKKEHFMDKLVNDYLRDNYYSRAGFPERDVTELNIAASRLVIDVLPGLEASAVFQTPEADSLIVRLFSWAEKTQDPLKTYAVGLLAAAMDIQDTAAVFKEQNSKFLPMMLCRLKSYQDEMAQLRQEKAVAAHRPFAHLNHESTPMKKKAGRRNSSNCGSPRRRIASPPLMSPPTVEQNLERAAAKINGFPVKRKHDHDESRTDNSVVTPNSTSVAVSDCSNSSWAEMEELVIASLPIHPLTLASKQMLILRYLTPMGEYQEFLSYIFEYQALSLILNYTNIKDTRETRLGFEALKYLAALLCHKKVSIEFINMDGLRRLLEVPRPSVAATGVSICFYYLAYCEDAMEKICASPRYVISELVTYALWLLECSHNSGRCHATMFFGLSFHFRVILDEFDAQDGLRKLYNAISTLPILATEEERANINEDEECSIRQMVRHVAVALKRYFEAHLAIKAEHYNRLADKSSRTEPLPNKGRRSTPEEVQEQVETLLKLMPFNAPWPCVDEFHKLGGIHLLMQTITLYFEWNFGGRAETVQSILNVLAICCVRPSVQMTFCERLELPDQTVSVGLNIILGSCEGEVVPDPDVQKAALQVIINCVCAPVDRVGSASSNKDNKEIKDKDPPSTKKRGRSSEELIQKVWGSVRENNGIIVLIMLMMVKTPITDADALRALACRALSGLARCQKVCQIVSKLPALTNGCMQAALKDPILQEKRQEHVQFQKYYLVLLEHMAGKSQRGTCEDVSLTNIYRANVVAQTKITYNKNQLYQLIHQQLQQDGLESTATVLFKEAGLSVPKPATPATYVPNRLPPPRPSPKPTQTPRVLFPNNQTTPSTPVPSTPTSPIRLTLNKTNKLTPNITTTPNRSLQKQTRWDSTATGVVPKNPIQPPFPSDRVSLHSIVTEYLTNQHALCKNPMVTCPQFNLFVPHKCPEPKYRIEAPINHTMRFLRRQTGFPVGNSMDIRLTHSRFCPERTIRINADDGFILSCEFLPHSNFLAVGTYHGEVKIFNVLNGAEEAVYQCHETLIYNLQANRQGNLLLTSTTWRRPYSALWCINSQFDSKLFFEDEEYVEFSKMTQDKIVGTKETSATIFDIETGKSSSKMTPVLPNSYSKNRATFNPTDELILTDGVLFDVRSGKEIHKFDKLNSVLSGVFHPNGLEILSNTEIWDLRTFHLMRTVSALDNQHLVFNYPGSVIYTYSFEQDNDGEAIYESSFKTLESRNYSSIATTDTKKEIYHMACNKHDTQIAVVENQGEGHLTVQETSVKIYEVGRFRDAEDEVEEEEDDDMSEDGSHSGSNSDDEPANFANMVAEIIGDRIEGEEDDPDFVFSSNDDDDDEDEDESIQTSSSSDDEMFP